MRDNYPVPILLLVFNRIDTLKQVFEVVKKQKPKYLFVSADGPRLTQTGEAERCEKVRNYILDNIDWECTIKTSFNRTNLGCGLSVSKAITWFFKQVEEGIILEDDCLPNDSFFEFCRENLIRYRNHHEISIISGNNFQESQPMKMENDYYFSVFPSTWGWATWKRTWENYDLHIREWHLINKKELLQFIFREKHFQLYWRNIFDLFAKNNEVNTWDFQFYFHCMKRKQLAVIPKANQVSNIGHGDLATHTTDTDIYFANLPTFELTFPLKHPGKIERNYEADLFIQKMLFGEAEWVSPCKKLKRWVKKRIRKIGLNF